MYLLFNGNNWPCYLKVNSVLLILTSTCLTSRMCEYMLSCFSRVQLFVILWTVACQASLSMGFSRQEYWNTGRILEWVAMPSSRGSSRPRDQTLISYITWIGRWVLHHLGSPHDIVCGNNSIHGYDTKSTGNRRKNRQTGLHKNVNISGH